MPVYLDHCLVVVAIRHLFFNLLLEFCRIQRKLILDRSLETPEYVGEGARTGRESSAGGQAEEAKINWHIWFFV